mgnify:CR=1 FL=1
MTGKNKIIKPFNIVKYRLEENDSFPNNPGLPLLIYQNALELKDDDPALFIENVLKDNNWKNAWRNGILDYHHFHSDSHEVLVVYRGKALVMFGGPKGPEEILKKGDVAVLPAGTAHKRLQSDADFACVGAYPGGRSYDMRTGADDEKEVVRKNISQVVLPVLDPIYGEEGPLKDYWQIE